MTHHAPRPGRKALLTREMIADAALANGFESLTMTGVAERLGVSHAALYTHVADRSDLVLAAAERLGQVVTWPEHGDDWVALLRAEAFVLWDAFYQYPGLIAALDTADRIPENFQEHLRAVHGHLVVLGFDAGKALLAIDIVYDLAVDSAQRSAQLHTRTESEVQQLGEEWQAAYDDDLGDLMLEAITGEPVVWFQRKLDVVLAGIEARLAPQE
ncbi:MAG: TetR family transcriptional regulator [Actinomycetota bacterium]